PSGSRSTTPEWGKRPSARSTKVRATRSIHAGALLATARSASSIPVPGLVIGCFLFLSRLMFRVPDKGHTLSPQAPCMRIDSDTYLHPLGTIGAHHIAHLPAISR